MVLVLNCLGTFVSLHYSKSKLHSNFLVLSTLEPLYLEIAELGHDSELYEKFYDKFARVIGDFSSEEEVYDGFLNQYEQAIDDYIYQKIEPSIINSFINIISMTAFIKLIYRNE